MTSRLPVLCPNHWATKPHISPILHAEVGKMYNRTYLKSDSVEVLCVIQETEVTADMDGELASDLHHDDHLESSMLTLLCPFC